MDNSDESMKNDASSGQMQIIQRWMLDAK